MNLPDPQNRTRCHDSDRIRRVVLFSIITIYVLLSSGCAGMKSPVARELGTNAIPDHAIVKVFFATDRKGVVSNDINQQFGNERGTITYGEAKVSIPREHRLGEIELPSIWRLEFRENPKKHVVLLDIIKTNKDTFYNSLSSRILHTNQKSAFVFVHGYNVSFTEAAKRTAQISYDLGFDGAPVFYSWPSQGGLAAYTIDEQNVEWTQTHLEAFLEDFLEKSGADNIYLIAHSMGNRALTRAAASLLSAKPKLKGRLTEIILTAPDIDAEVFKRDIAPKLVQLGSPVTLYASSSDKALLASKAVHGAPRAGESGNQLVILEGIETIDATSVNTGLIGHSYFADNYGVLSDLYYLIRNRLRADKRFGLSVVQSPNGTYWTFKNSTN